MATVGLIASMLFSGFLVLIDCRRRKRVSAGVLFPTLLLLVIASRPLSEWVSGTSYSWERAQVGGFGNEASASPLDTVFFAFVIIGSLVLASARGTNWKVLLRANPAIVLFYLYFALSVFWSADPSGSLKRVIKDCGLLLVASIFFTENDPTEAIRAVYFRCASILLPMSVVFIKYYPAFGRSYMINGTMMFTGVTTQKNALGEICLVFGLMLTWDYLEELRAAARRSWKRGWDRLILIAIAAWLLHLSQSKTALICAIAGIVLIAGRARPVFKRVSGFMLAMALSLPFLVFFSQRFSSFIAPLVQALGRNMTFTGRTDIWQHLSFSTVNPVIGAGYWNFWGGPGGYAIAEAMGTSVPNAHSGYIDIYLDGGFIGLALLFAILITHGRRLVRSFKTNLDVDPLLRLRFAVLIAVLLYNNAESGFARISPLWFTTLLMIVSFPPRAFERRTRVIVRRPAIFIDYEKESAALVR
jgi:O-antigen ligase